MILTWIAGISLFVMMVLMTIDVIGREFMRRPLTGALELIELTLVVTVFAALPLASWRENHIVADLFDPFLSFRVKGILRAVGSFIGGVVFTLVLPNIWQLAARANQFGDVTPQLGIPVSWAIVTIFVLCGATALTFFLRAVLIMRDVIAPKARPVQ
ncbi:MAG: TRAP transporter small permease [Rhizobiaceae bacterium]|nr:TRAP transporter small permease [Rhizobiaceae bacterium]